MTGVASCRVLLPTLAHIVYIRRTCMHASLFHNRNGEPFFAADVVVMAEEQGMGIYAVSVFCFHGSDCGSHNDT